MPYDTRYIQYEFRNTCPTTAPAHRRGEGVAPRPRRPAVPAEPAGRRPGRPARRRPGMPRPAQPVRPAEPRRAGPPGRTAPGHRDRDPGPAGARRLDRPRTPSFGPPRRHGPDATRPRRRTVRPLRGHEHRARPDLRRVRRRRPGAAGGLPAPHRRGRPVRRRRAFQGVSVERSLGLVGAPNARDLGGLVTADGWRVRPGILLRAPALGRLADRDVAVLAGLGPAYVVDLRDASEIADAPPDRLPAAPAPVVRHLPLFDPRHPVFTYLSAVLQGHHGEGDQGLRERGTPTAVGAAYRWFVADPRAEAGLAAAVRTVLSARGAPVLYHCSAGKDRTGWLSVVLLTALGVPHEVAVEDYLATNDYARAANTAI